MWPNTQYWFIFFHSPCDGRIITVLNMCQTGTTLAELCSHKQAITSKRMVTNSEYLPQTWQRNVKLTVRAAAFRSGGMLNSLSMKDEAVAFVSFLITHVMQEAAAGPQVFSLFLTQPRFKKLWTPLI